MKWNEQQLLAILTTDKNIVVSASAGAGKTTVLVARLIKRIIEDEVEITRVLAMTFTEAAASEMKKRLLFELSKQAENPELDESKRRYANKQLSLAENAHISTIHSFCRDVIANHYAAINLNPLMVANIASESDTKAYKQKAFDEIFKEALTNDLTQLSALFTLLQENPYSFNKLQQVIEDIINAANNNLHPIEWIKQQQTQLRTIQNLSQLDPYILSLHQEQLLYYLDQALTGMKNLLSEVDKKYEEAVQTTLTHLLQAKRNKDHYSIMIHEIIQAGQFKHSYRKPSPKLFNDSYKKLVSLIEQEDDLIKAHNQTIEPLQFLLTLTLKVYQAFAKIKIEEKKIDFNDLEHFAYEILCANQNEVALKYQTLFQEIMVDEFQDSNMIQNAMIELLSNGKNCFRVGDIKQSIYRFRGAKPSIMQTLLEDENIEKIFLSNNYRSKKAIVDFNNCLFDQLMNIEGLSISYSQYDHQIADLPSQNENNEDVLIHLLGVKELKESQEELMKAKQIKSIYIAQNILKQMKETPYKKFSDYCILVRGHQDKIGLKQAFDQFNIPYYIDDKKGFIHSFSIRIIYSYLKFLNDPQDLISLVAILTSPLYGYQEDQLDELIYPSIFTTLNSDSAFIQDYHSLKKMNHLLDQLDYLYQIQNFYEECVDIQEKTNLDLFYQYALQEDTFTLSSFINFIDLILPDNKDSAIPIRDDDNVVKVMTIHQSKGLQFNVVYFYASMRRANPASSCVLVDDVYGLSVHARDEKLPYIYPTLSYKGLAYHQLKLESEEYLRLLYVATTRAKDRLHIVDCVSLQSETQELDQQLIYSSKGFTPLILSALKNRFEHFKIIEVENFEEKITYQRLKKEPLKITHYHHQNIPITKIRPSSHHENLSLHLNTIDYAAIGTQIHQCVEDLSTYTHIDEALIKQIDPTLHSSEYPKLFKLYQNNLYTQSLLHPHYHEYPYTLMEDGQYINGIIDYISFGERIMIVDFKSDRHVDAQTLKQRYHTQLAHYHHAISIIFKNHPVDVYIYSFSLNEMIFIEV